MEYKQITARIKKTIVDELNNFCKRTGTKKVVSIENAITNFLIQNDMDKQTFKNILEKANEIAKPVETNEQVQEQKPVETNTQVQEQKPVETNEQVQEQKPVETNTQGAEEIKKEDVEREFFALAKRLKSVKEECILKQAKIEALTNELNENYQTQIHLSKTASQILEIVSKRLGKNKNEIVSNYVESYNIEECVMWFHDFVLDRKERKYFDQQRNIK